ncbi:LacI family DNA-binding transcriptional regulator [Aquipuribacter sp. SD81]|uniref:LacI family DNA-binding transcriptional regulator n=1 Tax=Aquipuribacter sp. SD81 TaxID=3127703 RepID=UPI00301A6650
MASIEDVARATGVSTATVSRALRGLGSVAEPTRVRVQRAAQTLGYVPSAAAASLASGRTKAVGLVTPHVSRWFFSVAIETIEAVLRTHGYDVLLVILPPGDQVRPGPGAIVPPSRPTIETELLRKRVDATVVLTLPLVHRELQTLRGLGHAVVNVGDVVPGLPSFGIDDVEVGRLATRHLLDLGHTDVHLVGGSGDEPGGWGPTRDRYVGYREVMEAAGLRARPAISCDLTVAEGRRAARELLARPALPTGLVATSDELAIGLLHELRLAGVAVPGDVSVVGVDDHPHAELHDLTTIAQPVAEQAEAAARWLLRLLGTAGPVAGRLPADWDRHVERLPTALVVRGSTARARVRQQR